VEVPHKVRIVTGGCRSGKCSLLDRRALHHAKGGGSRNFSVDIVMRHAPRPRVTGRALGGNETADAGGKWALRRGAGCVRQPIN
jgi:hypothetical protein